MSEMKMTSLANKIQNLELWLKSQHGQEVNYGRALREAILGKDRLIEVEVLKSLGDMYIQRGKLSKDSAKFDKAAALYVAAILRCKDPDMAQTLGHRISYMEKLSRQLLQGYTPHYRWLSPDYWGTASSNVVRVAEICDKLDRSVRNSFEQTYAESLVIAIGNSDMFLELEVLKSLGDFYLAKGKKTSDVSQFYKAATMYNKALTRCGEHSIKVMLYHRILYMDKIREAVKQQLLSKRGRHMEHHSGNMTRSDIIQGHHLHPDITSKATEPRMTSVIALSVEDKDCTDRQYKDHLKEGEYYLDRADLDSAEQHFAAALKTVHVRDPTAQQCQREVEPLCKLGDVYSKRGQQTGDGGDFVKATALYNAAIARSDGQVLNVNIDSEAIKEVETSFLNCILDIHRNVRQDNTCTEEHKKQLKQMRNQIKLEMETIDQQLDPYVHNEDDPCVKEIEAKRTQAVRQLFENIAQQRKEFISLLVEECIELIGPPPCKYALIGLGSQATGLVTPYSDLEFAILVEIESEKCLVYFRNLTHYLHLKVVNLGETILPALGIKSLNDFYSGDPLDDWFYDSVTPRGFAFDGSMPKASKTPLGRKGTLNEPQSELICTPENMVSILQKDVTLYLKEGYHLATILRNPCLIAGEQDLIDTYMAITVKILQADGGKMAQQLAQEIVKETREKHCDEETVTARLIDVKKKLYRFPAVAVDCLALSSHIVPTTVWETIEEMEHQQVMSPNNAHNLTVLTSLSAELRLRTYIANGGQNENLSALASMETELHGQDSSVQTKNEREINALRSIFHLPNVKQLLRYYYTSVPLKRVLSESSGKKIILTSSLEFYENSPKVSAMMYSELCRYRLAISYSNIALTKDEHSDTEKMDLFNNLGNAWHMVGECQKAIGYHEQVLQMCRSMYGQSTAHPNIVASLNGLGGAWSNLGDHRKAISYLEQALQMDMSIYGKGSPHPEIATSLSNLGSVWYEFGDYRQAISYHEQALQMRRRIYGQTTTHPDIAMSINHLGGSWQNLGDYKKAIRYHEQALQMYRSIYGQNTAHPFIASSINNLGEAWRHLCDHRKAISYHEQALQMHRSIHGQNTAHPDIATTHNNLGLAWDSLGDYKKAISYVEEALQMRRSIYCQSKAHPVIATSLNNLGEAWCHLGDHRKAISYHEQTLQMYRSIYGQTTAHPDIATSLNNLGLAWDKAGDYKKAISYLVQALQMRRSIYLQSKAHPDIAQSLNNLGEAWRHLGDHRKAISYNEQALQMHRSVYGQTTAHPDIATSLNNLGGAWEELGDYTKSISYHEQAQQMCRRIYGQNTAHPHIAGSLNNLGSAWHKLGDHSTAIILCQEALDMARQIYPQDKSHPLIKSAASNLAMILTSHYYY